MKDKLTSLSGRFAAERKRLKLSQAEMGKAINKTREMVGRYERGDSMPSADALSALSNIGMDIYYILVGRKEDEPSRMTVQPDERALIESYQSLDDEGKQNLRGVADAMALKAVNEGKNKSVRKKPTDKT